MNKPDFKPVEKGFGRRTFNRILKLIRANWIMCDGIPGWERTEQGVKPPPWAEPGTFVSELWQLSVVDSENATVKIINPGQLKKTYALDNSGLITIGSIDSEFTATAGQFLVLEILPNLTTTLKTVAEWDGYPQPLDSEEDTPGGLMILSKYYHVLYEFVATDSATAPSIRINDTVSAEKRTFPNHLQLFETGIEDGSGNLISCYEPRPTYRSASS